MIINVNKIVEKGAKGIKSYLRLRVVVQFKQLGSTWFFSYSSWQLSWQPWPFWQLHGYISFSKNQSQPVKVIKVELIEYWSDEGKVSNLKTHLWWRG